MSDTRFDRYLLLNGMENKPRKSKAFIITFILVLILLFVGYWLYSKKDDTFKTGGISFGRIFEPLVVSPGQKPLEVVWDRIFPGQNDNPYQSNNVDPNNNPNNLPVVNISASPTSVEAGGSSIITWTSTNAMSCKTPDGTVVGTSGSFSTGTLNKSKSFSVSCTGSNGTISSDINIKVGNRTINVFNYPILSVSAYPSPIEKGGSSNISWNSNNTESCYTGEGNPTTTSGTFSTGPLNETNAYSVVCTGKDGTTSRNAFVIVKSEGSFEQDKCENGTDNPPLCTTLNGMCINGAVNPPLCTTSSDNKCLNGAVNPYACTIFENAFCTANKITKELSTTNKADKEQVTFLQTILSRLPSSAGSTYLKQTDIDGDYGQKTKTAVTLFQKDNDLEQTGEVDLATMNAINNKCNEFFNNDYNTGLSQCADGKDNDNDGKIDEEDPSCHTDFDGNNEASYDKNIKDEGRIKTNTECGDGINNDNQEGPDYQDKDCHTDGNVNNWESYYPSIYSEKGGLPTPPDVCGNGATNYPSCNDFGGGNETEQCENPNAVNYPQCNKDKDGKCLNGSTNTQTCELEKKQTNMCAVFDQYPLEFTDAEKAKLADLLRKFYLIAPTLKTEDDLNLVYNEIERYKSLIDQANELTAQCYEQTGPSYAGPKTKFGNPWYEPNKVGTYVDETKYKESKMNTDLSYLLKIHGGDTVSPLLTKYPPVQLNRCYALNWDFPTDKDYQASWKDSIPIWGAINALNQLSCNRSENSNAKNSINYDLNAVMLERLKEFEALLNIW